MKKRILSLALVLTMLLSCMLMLTSCPDDTPDEPVNNEPNVDESLGGGSGSSSVYPITDPNHPEAGADTEDKYVRG